MIAMIVVKERMLFAAAYVESTAQRLCVCGGGGRCRDILTKWGALTCAHNAQYMGLWHFHLH